MHNMQYVIFMDFALFFLNFVYCYRLFPIQCCIFMQKFLLFFCILVLHIYKNCCILSLVETRQDMKIQHFIKSADESLPFIITNIRASAKWQRIIFTTVYREYPARCFVMNMTKSRDIRGKIPSPQVIWNGF